MKERKNQQRKINPKAKPFGIENECSQKNINEIEIKYKN